MDLTVEGGGAPLSEQNVRSFSDPQLPGHLVAKFRAENPNSMIFEPNLTVIRILLFTRRFDLARSLAKGLLVAMGAHPGCPPTWPTDTSWLHIAICMGDLPFAYEAVRLGVSVHSREDDGRTALAFGCDYLSKLVKHGQPILSLNPHHQPEEIITRVHKIIAICIFLVEQHADVNEIYGEGVTALHCACISGSWDLIRVLLLHGADPGLSTLHPSTLFQSLSDEQRFLSLIPSSPVTRPPRLCPCASGKPLKLCHADPLPYPHHYICPCGSYKPNSACCKNEAGILWVQVWDVENDCFNFIRRELLSIKITNDEVAPPATMLKKDILVLGLGETGILRVSHAILEHLLQLRAIDPAYAYAAKKLGIVLPR